MPDPVWGEVGVAICVLSGEQPLDAATLLSWLRDRIATYKLPQQVYFWPELPRSAYGKVTKAELKLLLAKEPGDGV